MIADFYKESFTAGKSFIAATPWLFNAYETANRQYYKVVPTPEQIERATVFNYIRVAEGEHLGNTQDRENGQNKEPEEQLPLNIQPGMVDSLGSDFEVVSARAYQRKGYHPDDFGCDEQLIDVRK